MHGHHSKWDLRNVSKYFLSRKCLPKTDVVLYFLSEIATICVLHHYVYYTVVNERLNKLNQGRTLQYTQKLNFIFGTLLFFVWQKLEIDGFQSVFLPIKFISDEVHRTGSSFTKWSNAFIFEETLFSFRVTRLCFFHVSHQCLALLYANRFNQKILRSHPYKTCHV